MLHLEGEANYWWFDRLKYARVTVYVEFTQILVKRFDRRKLEALSIETFSNIDEEVYEEKKEDVSTDNLGEEKLPPPPAVVEVLASVGGALAYLQDGLENSTLRVQVMIQEVHEEEEAYTSVGVVVEEQPSPSPTVGEAITPVGGNLVDFQDVPKHQFIQGTQTFPP